MQNQVVEGNGWCQLWRMNWVIPLGLDIPKTETPSCTRTTSHPCLPVASPKTMWRPYNFFTVGKEHVCFRKYLHSTNLKQWRLTAFWNHIPEADWMISFFVDQEHRTTVHLSLRLLLQLQPPWLWTVLSSPWPVQPPASGASSAPMSENLTP